MAGLGEHQPDRQADMLSLMLVPLTMGAVGGWVGGGQVMSVAEELGHVTVMLKGREDIISDGRAWLVSTETGAMRRSGGIGEGRRPQTDVPGTRDACPK